MDESCVRALATTLPDDITKAQTTVLLYPTSIGAPAVRLAPDQTADAGRASPIVPLLATRVGTFSSVVIFAAISAIATTPTQTGSTPSSV